MPPKHILFITWDGPQVGYLENLFIPIFSGLAIHGYTFAIIQFTWGDENVSASVALTCERAGMKYRRIRVRRRPKSAGALLTALAGARQLDEAVQEWNIDLLMPRSLLPALAVLRSRAGRALPVLFDADGLPADERAEFAGLRRHGPTYQLSRRIEAAMVRRANGILVRTNKAIEILAERAKVAASPARFTIVTNGRDPLPFAHLRPPAETDPLGPRLCYLGSIGPQYQPLTTLKLAAAMRKHLPRLQMAFYTRDPGAAATSIAQAHLTDVPWLSLRELNPADVPRTLSECDVGLALRMRTLSMQAVAPIKLGDYLLAGLPIIGSAGVGEVEPLLEEGVMRTLDSQQDPVALAAWYRDQIAPNRRTYFERCRCLGEELFSLSRSIALYGDALEKLKFA